jgi:hypothetical protein
MTAHRRIQRAAGLLLVAILLVPWAAVAQQPDTRPPAAAPSDASQAATWPPSATVRQRSIALITWSWPRLT